MDAEDREPGGAGYDPPASTLALRVAAYVEAHGLLAPAQRVVVGLSGGVDSVVLLRTLAALGYDVVAAHLDHGLRPASAADADFARALAADLGVPVEAERAGAAPASGVEAWARAARYGFLESVARRHGADAVAVGHHRDDQAETVLLNLLRGAGLRGLAGMRPARAIAPGSPVRLVRPLLGIPRADIAAHASAQGWTWREDASNADASFRRNALRHRVVPVLRDAFGPTVDARVARAADLVAAYLDAAPLPDLDAVALRRAIPLDALRALPDVLRDDLLVQALGRWLPDAPRSSATVAAVAALIDAQPGQFVPLGAAVVWREREALRFFEHDPRTTWAAVEVEAPGAEGGGVATPRGTLAVEVLAEAPALERVRAAAPTTAYLDADAVPFPLTLRPWAPGDRIRPLGMEGHQAVSAVLTNAKVPSSRRAAWPVVESGGEVVWVVGVRLAERARVTAATRRAVRLAWEGGGGSP